MGQDICIRKDEKPLGYDWECGHEELYVRVNMYYNGSLYIGLWQEQKECEEKLELFGDLTIGVMFIMDRMAPLQIKNYLEKQAAESGESVKDLIKTWKDWRKKVYMGRSCEILYSKKGNRNTENAILL